MSSISTAQSLIGKKIFLPKKRKPLTQIVEVIFNSVLEKITCLVVKDPKNISEVKVIPLHAIRSMGYKSLTINSESSLVSPQNYSSTIAKIINSDANETNKNLIKASEAEETNL